MFENEHTYNLGTHDIRNEDLVVSILYCFFFMLPAFLVILLLLLVYTVNKGTRWVLPPIISSFF